MCTLFAMLQAEACWSVRSKNVEAAKWEKLRADRAKLTQDLREVAVHAAVHECLRACQSAVGLVCRTVLLLRESVSAFEPGCKH